MGHEETTDETAAGRIKAPPSLTPGIRRRLIVLVGILIALCGAWVAGAIDNARMQRQLREAAKTRTADDQAYSKRAQMIDMETVVTASREFVLFGPATGKVEVFFKKPVGYEGVEYHYVQRDGEWVMTDSGGCSGEECLRRAKEAFGDT
jgi:hypothetical protein